MPRFRTPPVLIALLLAAAAAATASAQTEAPARVASATLQDTLLVVSPEIAYFGATLRVAGPGDYEAIAWANEGELKLDLIASRVGLQPADGALAVPLLPDGRYGWEATFHQSDGSRRQTGGRFYVESGAARWTRSETRAERPALSAPELAVLEDPRFEQRATSPGSQFGSEDNGIVVNDTDEDNLTYLLFDNESAANWRIDNDNGTLEFLSAESTVEHRFVFETSGRMGIGTTVPQADLHIYRPTGNLRIADSDPCPNPNSGWEIEEDNGHLKLEVIANCPGDNTGGKVWFEGSSGDVGFGRSDPERDLHVASGAPGLRLEATPSGQKWDLEATSTHFAMVNVTTGQFPFLIRASAPTMWLTDGGVGIGVTTPAAMLHVAGSGRIDGDVSLGSSKELKTAFGSVSPGEVLARVGELPVGSWRYKTEAAGTRHIGPFAEDFQRLFGLGDGKSISVIDAQGITLAAIQALKQGLEEKESLISELQAVNAALEDRLREIEERLDRSR